MNEQALNTQIFGRKVIEILEDRVVWGEDAIVEIANLAKSLGLATGAADGEFKAV